MRQPISSRRLLLFPMFLLAGLLAAQEPELKPAPAAKSAETPLAKVVVPGGTHLPLVLQNTISTKTAEPGDPLYFETTYPVVVNNRILIPVGSFVRGTLTEVKRPGRIRGRGELHVRFDELTLPNGYTVNLTASLATTGAREGEEVDREEGSVKSDSTKGQDIGTVATTGGAGAGIGAIAGGAKGAGIGAGVGAAAGLAAVPYAFVLPSFVEEGYGRWGFFFASSRAIGTQELRGLRLPAGKSLRNIKILTRPF